MNLSIDDIRKVTREEIEVAQAPLLESIAKNTQGIAELKSEVRRQGVVQEEMNDKLQAVLEGMATLLERERNADQLQQVVSTNRNDIDLNLKALREHINNKNIHRPSN